MTAIFFCWNWWKNLSVGSVCHNCRLAPLIHLTPITYHIWVRWSSLKVKFLFGKSGRGWKSKTRKTSVTLLLHKAAFNWTKLHCDGCALVHTGSLLTHDNNVTRSFLNWPENVCNMVQDLNIDILKQITFQGLWRNGHRSTQGSGNHWSSSWSRCSGSSGPRCYSRCKP